MPLSDKRVKEFKEIYQRKTGKEIDFETARGIAEGVVNLFKILAKIDQKKNQCSKNN